MKLEEVVPWGRTLAEYRGMFALDEADLEKRILGCGDGPASFNAEMTELGNNVISADPVYAFSAENIRTRVNATYTPIISQLKEQASRFVWQEFASPDELGAVRLATMGRFLADFEAGLAAGRYVAEELPELSFSKNQFDIALVSHLLFLYTEQLTLAFHIASVRELLRVSAEVRIFPLLDLNGVASPYVAAVQADCVRQGYVTQIETVDYEFQRGGNQMLRVGKR